MSFLAEITRLLTGLGFRVETGVLSGESPEEYVVITPMSDTFVYHADNSPMYETQEARLSLFSKGNYIKRKNQIVRELLARKFLITARVYVDHEDDTGYHHYAIDVEKHYEAAYG